MIYRWVCKEGGICQHRIHTFMMDEEKYIQKWHMRQVGEFIRLEAPDHVNTLDFKFTDNEFAVRRNDVTGVWEL